MRFGIGGLLGRTGGEKHLGPELKYRLGASSNLFSGVLPEGIYYPEYTTLEDYRPLEFISIAGQVLEKPWTKCTILDLGCGEGTSSTAIARTGARVIGIDGRPEVLARAQYLRDRLGYTNLEFRTGSVLDGSLWEKADLVYATGLIHHLQQPFQLMELIGQFCSDFVYFCTHLAPATEAHRAGSFFSGLLHEAGSVEFRGRTLPGIRFREGDDTREKASRHRRNPRAGIGNTYSWWPTEESFVGAMKEAGFPMAKRLAAHDYRLRYRLCFRRGGQLPAAGAGDRPSFWGYPERPHPDVAAERSLAADIRFLKQAGISPVVAGTGEAAEKVCAKLSSEGIRPSRIYVAGNPPASLGTHGVAVAPYDLLAADGPKFVVIAADRFGDFKKWMADCVTLRACRYAFTSFTLPEIRAFPVLLDPVTGEPADGPPSSGMRY